MLPKSKDASHSCYRNGKTLDPPDDPNDDQSGYEFSLQSFSRQRHTRKAVELMSLSQLAKRRRTFVQLAEKQECSFSQLCAQFFISRSTGYRWLARYREMGPLALSDSSRRPKNSPTQIAQDVRDEVLQIRRKHKAWGATRIRRILKQKYGEDAPSETTINRILKNH